MNDTHKGDPYAAWAGAEKRLQSAMDTIAALRARVGELERDLESGFMQGAYARLKNLQEAERALYDLFQACSNLCLDDMNKLETEINVASAALTKGAK